MNPAKQDVTPDLLKGDASVGKQSSRSATVNNRKVPQTNVNPVFVIGLIPLMLFAPLAASIVEDIVFGSDHVYEFFDSIHLADPLDAIYTPVMNLLPIN